MPLNGITLFALAVHSKVRKGPVPFGTSPDSGTLLGLSLQTVTVGWDSRAPAPSHGDQARRKVGEKKTSSLSQLKLIAPSSKFTVKSNHESTFSGLGVKNISERKTDSEQESGGSGLPGRRSPP